MDIPRHVAIILDGNGRWAKKKGMPRTYGHTVGAKNVETILKAADEIGIKYVTMYAFSTENWGRPSDEVKTLMNILDSYLKTMGETARKNNTRMRCIGDISRLDEKLQRSIRNLEEETKGYTGLNFQIALNYGSRDEMVRAMKKMYEDMKIKGLSSEDITEETFESYLDTADIPDPDLLIRTSGEQRLSNFLMWQLAYTEFYFTPVPWPEFTPEELRKAVEAYSDRDRRYGKV